MSDIFYSQVDAHLQNELNARGRAGKLSRTTADLQYMLGKIANVELVAYETPDREKIIDSATLGGKTVRGGEYLPSGPNGFLTDRKYNVIDNNDLITPGVTDSKINSSRRIPPFISSCDVNIGDHSSGMMNTVTLNLIIPNPERDLNFIESVYFRPGRACKLTIMHPDDAILSETAYLTRETLPSTKTLIDLKATAVKNPEDLWKTYGKMNTFVFDALITSFMFEYLPDMSVSANLTMKGISNIYPDLKIIMDSAANSKKTADKQQIDSNPITLQQIPSVSNPFTNYSISPTNITNVKPTSAITSIYQALIDEVNSVLSPSPIGPSNQSLGYNSQTLTDDTIKQGDDVIAIKGAPFTGSVEITYITLAWLIDFVNRRIMPRMKTVVNNAKIICTKYNKITISNYYEHLVSSNPQRIFISNNEYGNIKWFGDYLKTNSIELPKFADKTAQCSYPTSIFINTEVIQTIISDLQNNNTFTLADLFKEISAEIQTATGGAINMSLITHPEISDALLYYDANRVNMQGVKPYSIPMFSNHKNGTVIRDFKFQSNISEAVSTLAYVTNRDPGEISESQIAPFLSYMYTANTVTRSGTNEYIGNLLTPEQKSQLDKTYKDNHLKYLKDYTDAITAFGQNPSNSEAQKTLTTALQKHIQFPTESPQTSSQLLAPIIPFDVEFTVDGINGFRYGDVLDFDAIPTRYKINNVFIIVNIVHTVGADGIWTTTIRCLMRAKID